jgi:hypothetical protein
MKTSLTPVFSRKNGISDDIAFPALPDAYTDGCGILTSPNHRGCRVLLGKRVQTGGGRWGAKYSRFVKFQCSPTCTCGFRGWALLPENEFVKVLTFAAFSERKQAA